MSHPNAAVPDSASSSYIRPLQTIPWSEKTEDWFKQNINHYIQRSSFNFGSGEGMRKNIGLLYDIYNNQFPAKWFSHITNPLSAKKEVHKRWPARIRPTTILRPNIDLLMGEYMRRPFVYNVSNLGESGYSRFTEKMSGQARTVLTELFVRTALEEMAANGQELTEEQIAKIESDPPVPEEIKKQFMSSYKDEIAVKGQKFLKRQIAELDMRRKFLTMLKDWLVTGEVYSYKGIEADTLVYNRVSPMCLDYDKSHSSEYIEDGEWVVYRDMLTLSDIVDRFYPYLTEKQLHDMERGSYYASPNALYNHLKSGISNFDSRRKVPIYHVQWKGRKKVGVLTYQDPETGEQVELTVDETYVIDKNRGESVEWLWVNEVYEGWRLLSQEFFGMGPAAVQRTEMNNFSTCKLSYNGRKYSETHSENMSVLELGVPFQIMHIIVGFILERTIAKSKGKIVLIDKNAIPDDDDWDEEKFFYYGEAMGYAMMDRSKPNVDKSWNQYQVLDLSLFDQIKQLIELQEHYKNQWDEIVGITRQRKGQTYSSDGQGVNERSIFQSTVITDMIHIGFEQFVQRELQGVMDLGKFVTAKGMYGLYNDDEYGMTLLEIMPEDFMNEELGVFVTDSSEEMRKLNEMRANAQAMLQNGAKYSTLLEIIDAVNVSELKQKLKHIEQIETEIEKITQQEEFDAAAAADERAKRMMEYEKLLERENMNSEYDRKEDLEVIKGTFNTYTFQDGDANDNGVPDAAEIQKLLQGQQKLMIEVDKNNKKHENDREKLAQQRAQMEHQFKQDKIDTELKRKKLSQDARKIRTSSKTKH